MLVDSFPKMKKYLPAAVLKGDNLYFDDMLQLAEDNLVLTVIGEDLLSLLKEKNPANQGLLIMCERIISLDAFARSIPEMDLVLTESGFAVHNSEKMSPASKQRVSALAKSIAERLDSSIDSLIDFLLSSSTYANWRNTVQFDNISSGFICTFKEFKRYAQYSPAVGDRYPKTYADFSRLYPNFNRALLSYISPYLSADYCNELVEKYKYRDALSIQEKQVMNLIKFSLAAFVMGDGDTGNTYLFSCLKYMKGNIEQFPTFAASSESKSLDILHKDTPIFSML
jgi:hypothetical protein